MDTTNPEQTPTAPKLEILTAPNPALQEVALPVVNFLYMPVLAARMRQALAAAGGVGLAAPQVGVPGRMFVTYVDREFRIFCNPEIVDRKGTTTTDEGCLSFPGLVVPVRRAKRVRVKGQDVTGKTFKAWFGGLLAVVIQHELDHLNGVTLADKQGVAK